MAGGPGQVTQTYQMFGVDAGIMEFSQIGQKPIKLYSYPGSMLVSLVIAEDAYILLIQTGVQDTY